MRSRGASGAGEWDDGEVAVRRVPARVGLVGNPSDGHGGAVLATVLPSVAATVTASPSESLAFGGDLPWRRFASIEAWLADVERNGHPDDQRIIGAALWVLVDHLRTRDVDVPEGVTIAWTTDIARSVGLAGSSALAVGVIDAVASVWSTAIDRRVVAALALRAEREVLGIAAGWQDRIVQSHGRTVLVDASALEVVDGVEVPIVELPDAGARIELVAGWAVGAGESSDAYHAPLRRAAASLVGPMAHLATLARAASAALAVGDVGAVAQALGEGWRTRQACAPLRPDHAALVTAARAAGLEATTPGSGGSVVVLCVGPADAARGEEVLRALGCETRRWTV